MPRVIFYLVRAVLVAVVFCFIVPACAFKVVPCEGRYKIDDSRFTTEQRTAIIAAGVRWNEWSGKDYFKIGDESVCRIVQADLPDTKKGNSTRHPYEQRVIEVDFTAPQLKNPRALQALIMHELGHEVGMQHVSDPDALISDKRHVLDFNESDREECKRVGFCLH